MESNLADELPVSLAIILLVMSLTVVVTALATRGEDQEPNSLIGIKTRATKSSKEAWVAAHRIAYPYMLAGAAHSFIASVIIFTLLAVDAVPPTALNIISVALALGAATILTTGGVKADREARLHPGAH